MKKLMIIAIAIAIVAPAMAVQIIGPSPSPSGTIPVMMTIDRFAEILLPDQIVLDNGSATSLTADWSNGGGDDMYIRTNFDCEIQVEVTTETAYIGIGTWDLTLSAATGEVSATGPGTVNIGDYATALLTTPTPTLWNVLTIALVLGDVDLSSATYSPTAVQIAHVDVTVVSQ